MKVLGWTAMVLVGLLVACSGEKQAPQAQATPQVESTPAAEPEATPEPTPTAPADEGDLAAGQVIETQSGLRIEVHEPGTGALIKRGQSVKVHYAGRLEDGTQFDASKEGMPLEVQSVGRGGITGWTETLLLLRNGSKVTVTIPPELAYGRRGFPGHIPPDATLTFDMQVVDVK